MRGYLLQHNQTLNSMTPEQQIAYQQEEEKFKSVSIVIVDTLKTVEKFCRSMPLDWILNPQRDFSAACFHLIREPTDNIQVLAMECLEQLCLRGKLSYEQWIQWLQDLPQAIQQANQVLAKEQEYKQVNAAVLGRNEELNDPLTDQIGYHKGLSQLLATTISSHISHITHQKYLLKKDSAHQTTFINFLRFLVDMLHHPAGIICGTQLNLWIALLRDPQITKAKLLQPFVHELLNCYMNQMIKIRWEDVEEQLHPQSSLLEATWGDDEEYYSWSMDFRSKASQLFKHLGNSEPDICASVLQNRIQALLAAHAYGEPRNHLHPQNQQLTQASEAVRQFEAIVQPIENIMMGLPSWALVKPPDETPGNRSTRRATTQSHLSEVARLIVNWNPTYLWLKFRRAQLLEGLRHYWKYDPSTLLQGVDSLLAYIGAQDEWGEERIEIDGTKRVSGETVGLRKRSSTALVAVSKHVPQHLVPYITQLSSVTRKLLSSEHIEQTNRMHLYEFLSCVATSVEDPTQRTNFIANVLSDAIAAIKAPEAQEAMLSVENFMAFIGISQAAQNPASVTDPVNAKNVTNRFAKLFSAFNQLLSVGKRCYEANKKRPNGGLPNVTSIPPHMDPYNNTFPDEGPISLQDLSIGDPFIPLWVQILPELLKVLDALMRMWRPEQQALLLRDRIQRYALAISDDEAYMAKKTDGKSGGVFGEGGTAGSVISGTDRRDLNLAPRWSGWLNELRNTCFQMLGLVSAQRVLYAPEISHLYPRFVEVVVDPKNLRAMEHRHCTQYLKQFLEVLLLTCPKTLYMTHLAPILGPVLEHMQDRLNKTWGPIVQSGAVSQQLVCKPLYTNDCEGAIALASRGDEEWLRSYYARSGLFVGDLDSVTGEAAVEKHRVEVTRTFCDAVQSALALKGDWALVLANLIKEEAASKSSRPTKVSSMWVAEGKLNADGTPKRNNQAAIDARKLARISAMCHFLFLEHEQIAGFLTLTIIQCMEYPDAYTCRRISRICHRCLEAVAWHPRYTDLLGTRMFSIAVKNIVMEPKWMVGVEWEMISVARDIYCRLVLGQVVQPGGQGAGLQQPTTSENPLTYEQAKTADRPLQGGGILMSPSDLPRQVFASLPGITVQMIQDLDRDLNKKRAAKDQKDFIRDLLRIAADNWTEAHPNSTVGTTILDRAAQGESLLHSHRNANVEDIPEKLVTQSMMQKKSSNKNGKGRPQMAAFHLS